MTPPTAKAPAPAGVTVTPPPGPAVVVELRDIKKTYRMGSELVQALRGVSLSITRGDYVSIMGSSGSGKSTMLNLLGALDRPTSGHYLLNGEDVSHMSDDDLSAVRNRYLGFVFQSFNLIEQLTVLENIEVPLFYRGLPPHLTHPKCAALAQRVGLGERLGHRPSELSGGQQQRVAIARALSNDPLLILADEPTGNLDSKTENEVLNLFEELNDAGVTIIVVTHDDHVADRTRRVIRLRDGVIESDKRNSPAPVVPG